MRIFIGRLVIAAIAVAIVDAGSASAQPISLTEVRLCVDAWALAPVVTDDPPAVLHETFVPFDETVAATADAPDTTSTAQARLVFTPATHAVSLESSILGSIVHHTPFGSGNSSARSNRNCGPTQVNYLRFELTHQADVLIAGSITETYAGPVSPDATVELRPTTGGAPLALFDEPGPFSTVVSLAPGSYQLNAGVWFFSLGNLVVDQSYAADFDVTLTAVGSTPVVPALLLGPVVLLTGVMAGTGFYRLRSRPRRMSK